MPSLNAESVSKHLYKPLRHEGTKNNLFKIDYYIPLCFSGINIYYVLRKSQHAGMTKREGFSEVSIIIKYIEDIWNLRIEINIIK